MKTIFGNLTRGSQAIAIAAILGFAAPAFADDKPNAAEISAAVSDHTYQGSMSGAGSTFAEYYAADGSITANGYTGKWRAEDGLGFNSPVQLYLRYMT